MDVVAGQIQATKGDPKIAVGGENNMCEANAYIVEENGTRLIMEAVDTVEPEEDGLRLVNIFGEQKYIKAHIASLSLVDHKIFLKI